MAWTEIMVALGAMPVAGYAYALLLTSYINFGCMGIVYCLFFILGATGWRSPSCLTLASL
ncbi:MAG TPA: hypothetical protein VK211_02905 [Kamptonema sp.]|nr:hypothetical protein [Kamptonema sp.]